jgi:hypothetical protein
MPGKYTITIGAQANKILLDRVHNAAKIDVIAGDFYGTGRPLAKRGLVLCDYNWCFESEPKGGI